MMEHTEHPKASIMLVEDDLSAAQLLTDVLEASGYRVTHVENGAEAKAELELHHPDLIILDLMLPDEDGLLLCSKLKDIANVPVIICSDMTAHDSS